MPVIRKLLSAVLLSTSLFISVTLLAPICAADLAAAVSYDRAAPDAWAVNLPGEGTQYLFCHRMFASETYLFFCIEKESPNEFAVYCTEDFGKSFTRLSVDLSALTYSRAVPVYAGGGAGSGEGEFIVELRSADGSKYVSFNNYHYTDSSNWLDFRCTGEVDGTYLADLRTYYPDRFHDQPEIPLYGQPYTPSATAEKLEADGWECTRTRTFTNILGFSGEMRTYSRNGESRTVLVDGISGKTIFVTDRSIQSADIDGDGRREIRTTESRTDADGYSVYDDRLFMRGEDGIYVYGISKTMRAYIPNAHYQRLCMTNEGAMRIEYTLYSDEYRSETVSHHVRWTEEGLRILETRIRRYDLLAPVDSDSPEWSAEYDPVSNKLCLNVRTGGAISMKSPGSRMRRLSCSMYGKICEWDANCVYLPTGGTVF